MWLTLMSPWEPDADHKAARPAKAAPPPAPGAGDDRAAKGGRPAKIPRRFRNL